MLYQPINDSCEYLWILDELACLIILLALPLVLSYGISMVQIGYYFQLHIGITDKN